MKSISPDVRYLDLTSAWIGIYCLSTLDMRVMASSVGTLMLQKEPQFALKAPAAPPSLEFIALIAAMMALTALSVDIMLPALGEIGRELQLPADNDRQLIITFYLLGFAAGQPFFGPLSDRFGRKPPLFAGLALFTAGSIAAGLASTPETMFAARALQGFGASGPRIIALAILRDRFAGRQMSRVMSFIIVIFVITPILAPALGQSIMQAGPWRMIFAVLVLSGAGVLFWLGFRLAETHPSSLRLPLCARRFAGALGSVLGTRQTVGYAVSFGFVFGVLMSYIVSAEQIFVDVYGLGEDFPIVFGAIASVMILASFTNARLVARAGMRRVSHLALLGLIALCGLMAAFGYPERPPLALFCLFMTAVFFCFGLIAPNFNALAMEPMGHIAGTASSFIGFYTTGAGAIFGYLVGQSFNGTVRPLAIGFTLLAIGALIAVLITERGQLARSR